ncbi:MAG TPA: YfhO family protein, partial [Thermoanaerobaculia bacterium]
PFNVVAYLLPLDQALTFGAAMTFFLAVLFTFGFARSLGIGEWAALIAAAGFAFCGILAFFVGWPLGRAWGCMPLVFLGVRLVVREQSVRAAAILTIAFVVVILAGHPESVLHIVASGAAYGVFEVMVNRERRARAITLAVLSGLAALGLTAISLMPFEAASKHTREYQTRVELFAPAEFDTSAELVLRRAGVALFPYFGGPPWHQSPTAEWDPQAARVGSVVLALALAAMLVARSRRELWFFAGLFAVCFIAAIDGWPVAHLLHEIPLFDMALNERLAYTAAFALAILAAMAVDAMPGRKTAIFVAAFAVVLGVVNHFVARQQIANGVDAALVRELVLAEIVPLALLALLLAFRIDAKIAVPAILALVLVQRTIEDGGIYPAIDRKAFYPEVPILAELQRRAAAEPPFRIAGLHYALIPDTAALYDLEDVRGYEAMTFLRLVQTYPLWSVAQPVSFNIVPNPDKPFLSFLNMRYAIGSLDAKPNEQWRLVMEDRRSRLLENTRVLPRAFVPPAIRYERDDSAVLKGMAGETDFSRRAWILAPEYPPHQIANGPGTIQMRYSGLDYDLTATMENDGWVVVSNTMWPGWRAYIDGRRVEPRYANHAFLGVFVPKGVHRVQLLFRPEAYTRGRNISVATLVLLALIAMTRSAIRRTRPTSR